MIKRRFYKLEHGDKDTDNAYSSESSSSDSEVEETEELDNNEVMPVKEEDDGFRSTSSGYESEDNLGNEVDDVSSGHAEILERQSTIWAEKDSVSSDVAGCIFKCKSVFRCKLCPKVVCLKEESLMTHLKSKGHARSEKLLKEGKCKPMGNSDGRFEEDGETHEERHARTVALAQDKSKKIKNKGRQRQKERSRKKKMGNKLSKEDVTHSAENPAKESQSAEKPAKKRQTAEKPAKKRRKSEN